MDCFYMISASVMKGLRSQKYVKFRKMTSKIWKDNLSTICIKFSSRLNLLTVYHSFSNFLLLLHMTNTVFQILCVQWAPDIVATLVFCWICIAI